MRQYLCFLFCLFCIQVSSQEFYQLFRPNVQYLYEHQLPTNGVVSPLLGMQLGSMSCQTTYESLLPNLPEDQPDCLVRTPAFIGSEICLTDNLTQLNLQSDEDPLWLELRTQAPVGAQWLAALHTDSIFARVDEVLLAEILGLTDSVKSIGLYTKNTDGELIPMYEEPPLQISRNYGLVKAVFLHWLGADVSSIELAGMSQPAVGVQNPERATVFDLQNDDEFHWLKVNTTFAEGSYLHTYEEEQARLIAQYWTSGNATRGYVFSLERKTYFVSPEMPTDTLYSTDLADTISIDWEAHAYLNEQPGALLLNPEVPDWWQSVLLGESYFCDRPAKQLGIPVYIFNDDCSGPTIDLEPGNRFYQGLGGPFYEEINIGGLRFRSLQYAQLQDDTSCGIPFDFVVGTKEPEMANRLKVWPNPADQILHIEGIDQLPQGTQIHITDAQGRRLSDASSSLSGNRFHLAILPAGMYFLSVYDKTGRFLHQVRFVKL